MRAGFYIRRRPQYHPALDPPPSYTAAQLHPAAGFGRVSGGFRAGFGRVSPRPRGLRAGVSGG